MQDIAWYLTLALVLALAAVFVYVVMHSGQRREYEQVVGTAYRIRGRFFWVLVAVGIGVTAGTLLELPYAAADRQQGDVHNVEAVAHQWYWTLSHTTATVGQPVVFHVKSADVNHSFGLYDEDMRLLAQTQAMPGYVNRLAYTFGAPGTYRILCLEYCGVAHHSMSAEFQVSANN